MANYGLAAYRQVYQGFIRWGAEAGMISGGVDSIAATPLNSGSPLVGYSNLPSVRIPNGARPIKSIGSYRNVTRVKGARNPSMSAEIMVGDGRLFIYGLRSSGLGGFRCLPVLRVRTGAVDPCSDGDPFSWELAYAMINNWSLSMQNGQDLRGSVNFAAVALLSPTSTPSAANDSVTEAQVQAAGGGVLTFHHVDWVIGGTSFREILMGVNIGVNNNVHPIGPFRRESGDNDPLSRGPSALAPGVEDTQVSYRLADKIPGSMFDAAANAGNWGSIQIVADDSANNSVNPTTLTVTIANNVLEEQAMEQGEPGSDIFFSTSTLSDHITVTQTKTFAAG